MKFIDRSKKQILKDIDGLLSKLFPINRSITGEGVRETYSIIKKILPINTYEIESGTKCFDWVIPKEWNIKEAWIKDINGNVIINFDINNLHVLNYSAPVNKFVSYKELSKHIYTLPSEPDAIPYRTSYYEEKWGFCMEYNRFSALNKEEEYHVFIDSSLDSNGSLSYADFLLKGNSSKEYIISTYSCHPSLANDNLSGLVLSILLAKILQENGVYHNYRFIIVPETIGAIAYLHENKDIMKNVKGGYVISTVAGKGRMGYKESFLADSDIDRSARLALKNKDYIKYKFVPDGSDERQYSSPGFRIPIGTITKDKYYSYKEYHTSKDNLDFISAENLYQTLEVYLDTIQNLEYNRKYKRTSDYCEYQLGKYGLYPNTGGALQQLAELGGQHYNRFSYSISEINVTSGEKISALEWLSFYCDGNNCLLDISEKSEIEVKVLYLVAMEMEKVGLLKEID